MLEGGIGLICAKAEVSPPKQVTEPLDRIAHALDISEKGADAANTGADKTVWPRSPLPQQIGVPSIRTAIIISTQMTLHFRGQTQALTTNCPEICGQLGELTLGHTTHLLEIV